ncbi:MAG: hypothetical protein Q8O10_09060 [candidate division Zixibacteria bacterium]|nr:hypothetical protein [candidate division Zixibacteria bacterium]
MKREEMRAVRILVVIGIAMFLANCVPSLHPLFTEKDLVFDPALIGMWVDENGKNTWAFQKSGDNSYELVYTENESPAKFEAHLVKLEKFLFLDLFPEEPEMKNGLYKGLLIPVHGFSRIWIEGDLVKLAYLDPDWLKDMIDKKKIKIGHDFIDQGIILTEQTKDLQKFAVKYAEDSKAFSVKTELHRQK